ncbi:hypothetical protein L596_028763 [Steinernema carpocapsae]|uniref:Reverse transcriptase domain-containing protein n=1 Tax=Steinernema carpocapsae TaxID=34508 RepID=A0A4U5M0C9_STECR|nr:hypothetical protein L596_028763 [Steinernema carpocapsae]
MNECICFQEPSRYSPTYRIAGITFDEPHLVLQIESNRDKTQKPKNPQYPKNKDPADVTNKRPQNIQNAANVQKEQPRRASAEERTRSTPEATQGVQSSFSSALPTFYRVPRPASTAAQSARKAQKSTIPKSFQSKRIEIRKSAKENSNSLQEDMTTARKRTNPVPVPAPRKRHLSPPKRVERSVCPLKVRPTVTPTTKERPAPFPQPKKTPDPLPTISEKTSKSSQSKISEKKQIPNAEAALKIDFQKKNKALVDHLHCLNMILEKTFEYNKSLFMAFVTFKPLCGHPDDVGRELVNAYVLAATFKPQFCSFNDFGIEVDGFWAGFLSFNNIVVVLAPSKDQLEKGLKNFARETAAMNLKIDFEKTRIMAREKTKIHLNGERLTQVETLVHFGQIVRVVRDHSFEIENRTAEAWVVFDRYKEALQDSNVPIEWKTRIYKKKVVPALLHGCETWALKQADKNKLQSVHVQMVKRMIGKYPSEEVQSTVAEMKSALAVAMKRKSLYAYNIANAKKSLQKASDRLTKWRPQQKKRPGRPPIRWENDIVKMTGQKDWEKCAVQKTKPEWKEMKMI